MKSIVYKVSGLYAIFKSQNHRWIWTPSHYLPNCKHMGAALLEFRPNLEMALLKNVRFGLVIGVYNQTTSVMRLQAILPQVLNAEFKKPTKQGYGHSPINGKMQNFGDSTKSVIYFGYH